MLARKFRLPGKDLRELLRIRKKAGATRTIASPYFVIIMRNNHLDCNRFAVVISARAMSLATARHAWKRRITGNVKHWPRLGKDFAIIVSPKIKSAERAEVAKELQRASSHAMRAAELL